MRRAAPSPSARNSAASSLPLGLHPPIDRLHVGLRQIDPLDADVDDLDAEILRLLVDLARDRAHQPFALVAHHVGEARAAQHAPERGFENGAKARIGDALVAHALEEQQGIGDPVAGKGVDDEPLLVGGDDLLRGGIDVEDALVEIFDVLDEGDLVVAAPARLMTRFGLPNSSTSACCGLVAR